ncbi:hypothetical protein C0992_006589 [Termitomyces sp. T32_za158]|nr:hypothetical protein C0992_006589 [Termitomyces sp. T32_za158]
MSPSLRLQRLRSFNFRNSKRLQAPMESNSRAERLSQVVLMEFPHGKPTIADWATTMIAHYASYDDADPDVRHRRLSTLTVKELHWYRGKDKVEHDCVVAIIADPQYGCERFIRLDRVTDDSGVDVIKPFASRYNHYARSSVTISSQSSLPFDTVECVDAIWVLSELPRFDLLVERAVFRDSHDEYWAPTLLDLALVAKAVHENNTYSRDIWSKQCAWFSARIMQVMQSEFLYEVTHRYLALASRSQIIGPLRDRTINQQTQGTFEKDQVIFDIVLAYRAIRDDVTTQVEEAMYLAQRHKERHAIAEKPVVRRNEAAELVATATTIAIEATMKAAEAEARANKEARLREEAEERAHDEARRHAASKRELRDLRRHLEELDASFQNRGWGARLISRTQRLTTSRTLVQ